jgi:hypothetical protein
MLKACREPCQEIGFGKWAGCVTIADRAAVIWICGLLEWYVTEQDK